MNSLIFKEVNNFITEKQDFQEIDGYKKNCTQLAKINQKSREILTKIESSSDYTAPQAKIDLYHNVHYHLKSIQESLNTSKNFWQKIVSIFYFLTNEERELNSICADFNRREIKANNLERMTWMYKELEPAAESPLVLKLLRSLTQTPTTRDEWTHILKKKITENLDSPEGRLREAYFRVVGNVRLPSNLEGAPNVQSLLSIREDLQSFTEIAAPLVKKTDLDTLKKVDEQLQFAEKIATEISITDFLELRDSNYPEKKQARLSDIVYSIQSKLETLSPGDELILPGGYANAKEEGSNKYDGHAVIYSIKRKNNGKLSFTVINTGKGADSYRSPLSTIRSAFWDNQYSDSVFDDLDDSCFNNSFLTALLEQYIAGSTPNNMTTVFKILIEKLADGDANRIQEGRRHSMQANGTCSHDSVCCWLEGRLSPELFCYLDFYMKRSGLHKLESTAKVSHEVSHITATSFDKNTHQTTTLKGAAVIKKIQEIGQERFKQQRAEIEKEMTILTQNINDANQESAFLLNEETTLQEQLDPKKLETKLLGLKGRVKHFEDELAAEKASQSSQQPSVLNRISSSFKKILGHASEAAVQLAKVQEECNRCQQQIDSLSHPITHQKIEEQLSTIRVKQKASHVQKGSLQKQREFLEKLLS